MKKFIAGMLLFVLGVSTLGTPSVPVHQKTPEFAISNPADPSGKLILLSSLKGKVVVLAFIFIQSDHCLHVARTLNKLNSELGPRGFQAVGIVFDPPRVRESEGQLIQPWLDYFKLTFPVGFATKNQVDSYLGRTGDELMAIPQVVVIDRAGVIRAATGDHPQPLLENEDSLRTIVNGLLKESSPPATPVKPSGAAKGMQNLH